MGKDGKNTEIVLLAVIIILAIALRAWGLGFDLPYIFHPDEPVYILISQNIFKTGDLNPHFFNYPSLFFYLNAIAYIPYFLLGKMLGILHTAQDILPPITLAMGVTNAQISSTVILGRTLTLIFGTGIVYLTFLVGKQISNKTSVGLVAALISAISPTLVIHSRFVTPDTFVTFFTLFALLLSCLVFQQGKTWHYVLAGFLVGLSASSKYNGGLIIFALLLAHFLRHRKNSFKVHQIYISLMCCGIGFIATTPYSILDFQKFTLDLLSEARHYATGHAGMEGNTLRWYLGYLWNTSGILYIIATLGILIGFIKYPKETGILAIFPIMYFFFINTFSVRNDRTVLPMLPFLFVLASWSVVYMNQLLFLRLGTPKMATRLGVVTLTSIIILIQPVFTTIKSTHSLTLTNSRESARLWISENIPKGSKIVLESYAPYLEPEQFSVTGIGRMIDHSPDWFIEQGFEYMIFSQGMYGRFFADPERYSTEVTLYNRLFEKFSLVRIFTEGGLEIRIYKAL